MHADRGKSKESISDFAFCSKMFFNNGKIYKPQILSDHTAQSVNIIATKQYKDLSCLWKHYKTTDSYFEACLKATAMNNNLKNHTTK